MTSSGCRARRRGIQQLQPRTQIILDQLEPNAPMDIRDPTLLERLQGLNPLRDIARNNNDDQT